MKAKKGEITVFLSLVLVILISILCSVIEAARTNGIQFQTECVADMAIQSALAEYNSELLEQYDLFFVDTGYGTKETGYILLEEHLRNYMEKNFQIEKGIFSVNYKDLLQISADCAVILEAAGAADGGGEVIERKAVDYMLDKYGLLDLSEIRHVSNTVEAEGFLSSTMEEERAKNERAIRKVDTSVTDKDGKKHKIAIDNPADNVNSRRGSSGILTAVTKEKGISDKETNLKDYISHRAYEEKDGFLLGEKEVTIVEDLLFQKHLMDKCGYYTKKKEGSCLDYQMEYILAGKSSDRENLKTVVNRLLILRETANFLYLLTDSSKKAEAEALAMTLAAVILFPELKDLIKLSILIAWAYAESVNDVKILLEGGKVPLGKDSMSWNMSLKNAMKLELVGEKAGLKQGLTYEQYLHTMLAVMKREERNLRFMDIVEMDIRQTPGNQNFCMNHCIHCFTAEMTVHSERGHSYQITRTVGYLK